MSVPPFVLGIALFLAAAFVLRAVGGCMVRLAVVAVAVMVGLYIFGPRYAPVATTRTSDRMSGVALTVGQGAWSETRGIERRIIRSVARAMTTTDQATH
ncbi:MAG: hypothetical protein ACR2M1_08390 [Gemmatimonadaceae bacterium]